MIMNFGRKLKSLREKKGIGIKKLAPELGLDYSYISKLENSKSAPSHDVIGKVANYFNEDADDLAIAAGKIPRDIETIILENPDQVISYIRDMFSKDG